MKEQASYTENRNKVCVAADGNSLESSVAQGFGRCDYFIIVDPQTLEYEAVPNQHHDQEKPGLRCAKKIIEQGIKIVLTGKIGDKARKNMESRGIKIIIATGTVKQAVQSIK